ncbi:MAG: SAM-dependent methyltransferase [Arenicella sp.]|jgi:SAM-dependent methyltransferase
MSNKENNSGWRSLLSNGLFYQLVQTVFSERRSKQLILNEFVNPAGNGCKVLDIGCGPGNLVSFLPSHVHYFGLDVNPDYIESASKRFAEFNNAQFIGGTAVDFFDSELLPDETVDVVIIHGVLHHVEDDVAAEMFTLARKKLKSRGKMVVLEPVWFAGQSPLRKWVMTKDRGNNIKRDNDWIDMFTRLTDGWATSNTRIKQNLIRFYDLIVLDVVKN